MAPGTPGFSYGNGGFTPAAGTPASYNINSVMKGWVDRGKWVYYDTYSQVAGTAVASQIRMFQLQMGATDPNLSVVKTKLQTNMVNSGVFNPPRALILDQIGFMFVGPYVSGTTAGAQTILADILAFVNSGYFEFFIDGKVFFEGRLEFHPPGYGVTGFSTNSNEESWGLGVVSPHATYSFDVFAKYIAPLQNFGLNIYFPMGGTLPTPQSAGKGITLVALLKGLTDRSVQ